MAFKHINTQQLQDMMHSNETCIVDVRDPQSFAQGHIHGAEWLSNENFDEFFSRADLDKATVVCCYHGNSSQGVADHLNRQGFEHCYSLDGGYEAWAQHCART